MMRSLRRPAICGCAFLLVTMLVLLVTSCGNAGTGITGIVVSGPGIEVSATNQPTPSPLPGGFGVGMSDDTLGGGATLLVEPTGGSKAGQVVAQVKSGKNGLFKVSVPPGRYVVVLKSGKNGLFKVSVPPGRYVVVLKGGDRESDLSSQPLTVRSGRYSRVVLSPPVHPLGVFSSTPACGAGPPTPAPLARATPPAPETIVWPGFSLADHTPGSDDPATGEPTTTLWFHPKTQSMVSLLA